MTVKTNEKAIEHTRTDLIDNGWTQMSINRFLPQPRMESQYSRLHGNCTTYYWSKEVVNAVLSKPEVRAYFEELKRRRASADSGPRELPLLDAVCEASRSAQRYLDLANGAWGSGDRPGAGRCVAREFRFLKQKYRGILALHKLGIVRYVGSDAQGMAVYEYGDAVIRCFLSTLHPDSAKQVPVVGRLEVLPVSTKAQKYRISDVAYTIGLLPSDRTGYVPSKAPAVVRERERSTCWRCCEKGHLPRECW
jgi:hypothetical protein